MEKTLDVDRANSGIHAYLNRLAYVVINVSDLQRAVAFYTATLPVYVYKQLNGPAQRFRSLGIENGYFEGCVLRSLTAENPPGKIFAQAPPRDIHLVEWKSPKPVGAPYQQANHMGIYRHNSLVGDIETAFENVVKHNGRPYGPPSRIIVDQDSSDVVCFGFRDPDGTTLELVGPDTPVAGFPGALHHCNINCSDLANTYRFYHDVMGLNSGIVCAPNRPQPITNGSLGDQLGNPDGSNYCEPQMHFKANLMVPRNDWRNPLDILQWTLPEPCGEPYRSPLNLGIVRIGFEVDDIDNAHSRLVAANCNQLSEIETWDLGSYGRRRIATLRDPDGIMLEIVDAFNPLASLIAAS